MVRNLYLVRHGRVDFADGIHRCIGRTDIGLDETGRSQARALADYFGRHPLECIFSSPLSRAFETAKILGDSRYPLVIRENLVELDMGEWENRPLNEIKKGLETEPIYGEKRQDGCRRFAACIDKILDHTEGDVAVVAHAGINCSYLARLLGTPLSVSRALPQPYGGFSRIEIRDSEKLVAEFGRMTNEIPSESECEAIWEHYHTPEPVREHCRAVSGLACEYGKQLQEAGCEVDLHLIRSAALLHDVVRQKKDHPLEGAKVVIREGYPKLAPLLIRHHDWTRTLEALERPADGACRSRRNAVATAGPDREPDDPMLTGFFRTERAQQEKLREADWSWEAAVLYLADKEMQEGGRVTIEERFEASRKRCLKCDDRAEALAAHERRYREAQIIRGQVQERLRQAKR